jgi:hypothetical protein
MRTSECLWLAPRLTDWARGDLSGAESPRVERHLAACDACREAALDAALATHRVEPPADLLPAILAGTSGPACQRAETLLADPTDRILATVEAELLRGHLEHCEACLGLSHALRRMEAELPILATADPGPGFTAAVLGVVRRLGLVKGARREAPRGFWAGLMSRPRIAWETACAGTLILGSLAGPGSTPLDFKLLRSLVVAERPAEESWTGEVARAAAAVGHLGQDGWQATTSRTRSMREALGRQAGSTAETARGWAGSRWEAMRLPAARLKADAAALARSIVGLRGADTLAALRRAGADTWDLLVAVAWAQSSEPEIE